MRFSIVVLLVSVSGACASTAVDSAAITEQKLNYSFIENKGEHQCGPINAFRGVAADICTKLEFQNEFEVGCAETYIKWMSMYVSADEPGVYTGVLQIVSDDCDSTFSVTATAE